MRWCWVMMLVVFNILNAQTVKTSAGNSNTPFTQGWLGIIAENMSTAMLIALGIEHGVLISDVIENSPAAKAGIRTGDVVVEFDGKPVDDIDNLRKMVRARPGVVVEMVIVRQLKRQKMKVQIGKRSGVSGKTEFKPQFPLREIYRSLFEMFKKIEPQLQTGKKMYQQSLDSIQMEIERLKKELEMLKRRLEAEKIAR